MMLSISLVAEEVFSVGGMKVTNSLLTMWVGIFIVACTVILGMRRANIIPRGVHLVLESVYTYFLGLCESVLEDKKRALIATPFITTIFIFVFTANIFEIIPGVGTITIERDLHKTEVISGQAIAYASEIDVENHDEGVGLTSKNEKHAVPLFRPASTDLNMTLMLAIISVVSVQIVGFKTLGFGYLKKFFNFSNPINFFVGILELISEFAKIISFSFRLFGNLFAGEVLLTVMLMIMPYFIPIPFYGLEFFVAIVQAFVFAMLTLVFMKLATIPHGGEGH